MDKIEWRRTKEISNSGYLDKRINKKVSRKVSCRPSEVDGVVKEYTDKGYTFDKNRRNHGLCFLSFSKTI